MTSCSFIQTFAGVKHGGCAAQCSVATSIPSYFSHSFLSGFFSENECGETLGIIQTFKKERVTSGQSSFQKECLSLAAIFFQQFMQSSELGLTCTCVTSRHSFNFQFFSVISFGVSDTPFHCRCQKLVLKVVCLKSHHVTKTAKAANCDSLLLQVPSEMPSEKDNVF